MLYLQLESNDSELQQFVACSFPRTCWSIVTVLRWVDGVVRCSSIFKFIPAWECIMIIMMIDDEGFWSQRNYTRYDMIRKAMKVNE